MPASSFTHRFIIPVGLAVCVLFISIYIYNNAWRIDNDSIHQWLAFLAGLVVLATLWFQTLFVYPTAYFRGASVVERVLACFVTPLAFDVYDMIRVSEFFTVGESLYYGVNSLILVCISCSLIQMGICEMLCRLWAKRTRPDTPRPVTTGPVLSIVAGTAGIYVFLLWGVGVHWFYIYQQGYRALFH